MTFRSLHSPELYLSFSESRTEVSAIAGRQCRIEEPAIAEPPTILVIEDDDLLRELASRVLESAGHRVLSAEDGDAALRLCGQHAGRIDLALTDINVPGTNVSALVTELSRRYPTMKLIYMSGYGREGLQQASADAETARLIEKPFHPGQLIDLAREVLQESSALRTA